MPCLVAVRRVVYSIRPRTFIGVPASLLDTSWQEERISEALTLERGERQNPELDDLSLEVSQVAPSVANRFDFMDIVDVGSE